MSPFSHSQAEPLLAFKKPLEPLAPVSPKPEKELLLMTPVSNVPDVTRNIMALRPCHGLSGITAFLPSINAL